ncbi:Calmodulin-dependent protein kinase cmk2 [Yamadazyma tenuis]|uniref:Calmodulin-dependent protein kinase cmk2 n=1 Tax=Candida tenuis TaxID=2315449 RepID=UPI00279AFB90|nr:Calmodulin-dependent protein kinase cmk2 [Yamadazyma tenuis]
MENFDKGSHLKKLINKINGQPESYGRKAQYIFGKTLGAGSFGIVRYARNLDTGEEVAVKIILKKALKGHEDTVLAELDLLSELSHPHVVGFRDWFESKDKFYIVTQLATGGEMFDRIIKKGRFTEHDASLVIVQVLEALQYLHHKNIVHRDLKPENILYLTPEDNSNIVLADFGIAKKLQSADDKIHSSAGSFGYAAPEVVMGLGHGKPCDIWSLGVITYTVLCGYSPFRSENVHDFVEEVKNNNGVVFHADYWKSVSKDARRFIIKALQFNPDNRPTVDQLLNDPWLIDVAKEHKEMDLLPQIKAKFDGKSKFKQAIELVMLNNRVSKLKDIQTEDDDDPNEINIFGDEGSLVSEEAIKDAQKNTAHPLISWGKFKQALPDAEMSKSSLSKPMTEDSKLNSPERKKDLTQGAFVQLVHNKDRVSQFTDENRKRDDQ